jgi:Domain of unknown function (DUF1883)
VQFLHSEVHVGPSQAVVVELDHAANVKVMDSANFSRYRRGEAHRYYGGYATKSPMAVRPPRGGQWYVAVDLGGRPGHVRATIGVQ